MRPPTPEEDKTKASQPSAKGDAASPFEELYRRYFPDLVATCRGWGLDGSAEDIAQETLARAYSHLDELDLSRPWGWLRTTAFNLMVDRARRERRVVLFDPSSIPEPAEDPPAVEDGIIASQALSALPERHRVPIVEHYLEDRSIADAAGRLGISRPAFKQLLYRARRSFRAEWARRGVERPVGLAAFPVWWLKRFADAAGDRARRIGARSRATEPLLSLTVERIATAAVATLIVLGGTHPFPASDRTEEPSVADAASTSSAPLHGGTEGLPRRSPPVDPAGATADPADRAGGPGELVNDVTRPNRGVRQPEDAQVVSIAYSPRFQNDGTVLAAATTACQATLCPNVLFRSTDGGRTWSRLDGRDFHGLQLLLPPAYGAGDDRIFAMGSGGLQVSEDEGRTFRLAAVAGATQVTGSAAISPGFNDGDPTILIGAQSLMRYRDDLRTIEAVPSTAAPGPLEPAYPPDHAESGTVLVGGIHLDPVHRTAGGAVFTCAGSVCSPAPVSGDGESPRLRIPAGPEGAGVVYAFTSRGIFLSRDGGQTFAEVPMPLTEEVAVRDLAIGGAGDRVFAAVRGLGKSPEGGLYSSEDDGATWRRSPQAFFRSGVGVATAWGDIVLVGLGRAGIACSIDGGITWARRCR